MFAKDYRNKAWAALKGNWGVMVVIYLIYTAITAVCGVIPTVGAVIALLIGGPLVVGFCGAALKVLRGETPEIVDLFDWFKVDFVNAFLLHLLNSIFIALWSLLFFIPGIVKSLSYSMSYYILRDNPGMTHSQARKASMVMMEGHKWRLFCLQFSFIGWMLLSGLTFGILLFWVAPYMQTATAAFYESLKAEQAPVVTVESAAIAEEIITEE